MLRVLLLLLGTGVIAGCELIGDVFQAGLVVGVILIIVVVAAIGWIYKAVRGRGRPR